VIDASTVTLQQQGAYQTEGVSAKALNGFGGTIKVSLSGLASGISVVGDIAPFSPAGIVTGTGVQLSASPSAAVGTSTVTVTGTSGAITHTATFQVSVTAAASFDIQLSPTSLVLTPSTIGTVQVSETAAPGGSSLLISLSPPYTLPTGGVSIGAPGTLLTTTNPVSFNIVAAISAQPVQGSPVG